MAEEGKVLNITTVLLLFYIQQSNKSCTLLKLLSSISRPILRNQHDFMK